MAIKSQVSNRDTYIDFLRSLGLLLLVVAHTAAPKLIEALRTFDVPMMVFISALCYKPLKGGYLTYAYKRFIRIYKPVFIFLTLIFLSSTICHFVFGKPEIRWSQIIGSYLLLNKPSIGYIWIMRVFLIMALVIPLLYNLGNRLSGIQVCFFTALIILTQHYIISLINLIQQESVKFILNEFIPYLVGYSAIAFPALRIRFLSSRQIFIIWLILLLSILLFFYFEGISSPQHYKYPPQSLYILYGLFCSIGLWYAKPVIMRLIPISNRAIMYLSKNSMWIYLWHIIPVYLIDYFSNIFTSWSLRYVFVLAMALCLTAAYNKISSHLSNAITKIVKCCV